MNFFQYYFTEKRNPHKESFLPIIKKLEKYKDDPDIYISFTELVKLGINPQTEFKTVAGVYAYPLKEMWHDVEVWNIPYARGNPYVQIIKHTRKGKYILDIGNMNKSEYDENIDKLRNFYLKNIKKSKSSDFDNFIDDVEYRSKHNSDGGTLYYAIYLLSFEEKDQMNPEFKKRTVAMLQNYIWRKVLGYNMIGDISGKGIIHPNEKQQAVFLDKTAYDHIDTLLNKHYRLALINTMDGFKEYLQYTGLSKIDIEETKNGLIIRDDLMIDGFKSPKLTFPIHTVEGTFSIIDSNIVTLQNCPVKVGEDYICFNNKLKSLEYAPSNIKGSFDCGANPLENINGLPKLIGGNLYLPSHLKDKYTREEISKISEIKGKILFK